MQKMAAFVLGVSVLLLSATAFARNIAFESCGPGQITEVWADPCPSEPCSFKARDKIKFGVTFVATEDVDENDLTLTISVVIDGKELILPGQLYGRGCRNQGLTCPFKKGQTMNWLLNFIVPASPARGIGSAKFKMTSKRGTQFCINAPVLLNE